MCVCLPPSQSPCVCFSVCMYLSLSLSLTVCLSVFLSVCLSGCVCVIEKEFDCVCVSVCLSESVCLCACVRVSLPPRGTRPAPRLPTLPRARATWRSGGWRCARSVYCEARGARGRAGGSATEIRREGEERRRAGGRHGTARGHAPVRISGGCGTARDNKSASVSHLASGSLAPLQHGARALSLALRVYLLFIC